MGSIDRSMKTDLTQYSHRRSNVGPYADNLDVDVLIVGGGFGGIFCLKTLRDHGLRAVIYEAGPDLGGTWRFNCYPGARVDSEVPVYQFSWPEVYKDWTWSCNYPEWREIRAYFDHLDKVVEISKDCSFETVVTGAQFHPSEGKWHVETQDGRVAKAKYFIVAAGFASKRYIPPFKGLDKFKGVVHHSAFWPEEGVDVKGKRCAVIGTGSSGVQIIQEWGPDVGKMTIYQRTPNMALPMQMRQLSPEEQKLGKVWYDSLFEYRERCFAGFIYDMMEKNTFDDSPEERAALFHKLWEAGGFRFWLGSYKDIMFNPDANREAYNYWAKRVRERISDPTKRDILAPLEMPHFFGVKRPCLEQDYYEQVNRANVDVIDINNNPIAAFTETGIELADGSHEDFDVVAIATGFDIATGGMTHMGIKSIHDTSLHDEWKAAANTYLGMTVSGYPNMFHLYGPHGPTSLSNGPTTIEVQGRWIVDCIRKMERQNIKYINPTPEATKAWKKRINDLSNATLLPTTRSTHMGGSIPGKAFEQVSYTGGIPNYAFECRTALDAWDGFETVSA